MMTIILIHFRRGFPAAYTVGRQFIVRGHLSCLWRYAALPPPC
ncbi:Hypothetical protein SmN45_4479 [Serratia marcescens]|nr:Hypothetical protein SmN45_4479 [Serratia marcescens]